MIAIKKWRQKISDFYLFQTYPITKQFVKFCLVGFTNLFLDILVYWFLTRIFHWYYLAAAIISFIIAVSWSFFLNRRWTFRHQGKDITHQYFKFFIANIISMGLNLGLLYLAVDWLGIHDLLAKFLVAVVVAFFNFSLNRFWTFKDLAG